MEETSQLASGSKTIWEARCERCGDTFNPTPNEVRVALRRSEETDDEPQVRHYVRIGEMGGEESECGGVGFVEGYWSG